VVIQLSELRFNKRIGENQIEISEAKHGADLKDIMRWRVSKGGKQLVIEFKSRAGNFGSGNLVEVAIYGSAFVGLRAGERFRWVLTTDPL
jgi:hypothetical protein